MTSARLEIFNFDLDDATRTRRDVIALVAIMALHLILAWLTRPPGLSWGEDDAGYIQLAQDLTRFRYRELQDIALPMHARFPPGFPLLLAVIGPIVGWSVDSLVAFVALCSAGAIYFFFEGGRRVVGTRLALVCAFLYAINPYGLVDAGMVMSEGPFKLAVAIGFWALTRESESVRFSWVAGTAMIATTLIRSAGVPFAVALLVYWLVRRRFRRASVFALASMLTTGVWFAWSLNAPEAESRRLYSADLGIRSSTVEQGTKRPPIPVIVATQFAKRVVPRTRFMARNLVPSALAFPTVSGTPIDNAIAIGFLLLAGVMGCVALFRRSLATWLLFGAYIGLLLVWRWSPIRFVTPIIYLFFAMLLLGALSLARRLSTRMQAGVIVAIAALLTVGAAQKGWASFAPRLRCDRARPATSEGCFRKADQYYLQLAQWVRDSTPRDAVFLTSKERAFYFHSGRQTINQLRALQEDSLSLIPFLRSRGVTHVSVGLVGLYENRQGRLLAQSCDQLILLREFPMKTGVFRIRSPEEPGDDGAACALLSSWRFRSGNR